MEQDGKKLTREEPYARVWSAPSTQVAAELGISDVALAKRCKVLNVPKPSPGYWAKVAAGQKPEKQPLPQTVRESFMQAAQQPVQNCLPLPASDEELLPLAKELRDALTSSKPDSHKRIRVHERTLPEVTVTRALIDRAVKVFHAILAGVEPIGIRFRKAQGAYDPGYFQRGYDRLYLQIEEELIQEPPQPGRSTRRHSWNWQSDCHVGSGKLTFWMKSERYGPRTVKQWTEDENSPLGELLAQAVTEIRKYYIEAQNKRDQEVIEREKQRFEAKRHWREYQEKEAIRREKEQKEQNAEALKGAAQVRIDDLVKAAEWWRLHRAVVNFIEQCEQRWRSAVQSS